MSIDKDLNKNAVKLTAEDLEKLSGGRNSGFDDRRIRSALQARWTDQTAKPGVPDWGSDADPDNSDSL